MGQDNTQNSSLADKLISFSNLERFKANLERTYGRPGGLAQLNIDGKIPDEQISNDAFNVVEYEDKEHFPETGESKKIYVDLSTYDLYLWNTENEEYISASSPDAVIYSGPQSLEPEQQEQARQNIGAISASEVPPLPDDLLRYSAQQLDDSEKDQARANIGAVSMSEVTPLIPTVPTDYVSYTAGQGLNPQQQADARDNIGAAAAGAIPTGVVKYSTPQQLEPEEQAQARINIGAAASGDIPTGVVRFDKDQTGTPGPQKLQARQNIGAAADSRVNDVETAVSTLADRLDNFGNFVREINEVNGGFNVTYDDASVEKINTGVVFDGGIVDDNNYLHLKLGDNVLPNEVFEPVLIPAGGGPSGPSVNITGMSRPSSVRNGESAIFSFVATSSDDTDITVRWFVNNVAVGTQVQESETQFTFDVGPYLNESADNIVRIDVESLGGASIPRKWTVTTIAFAIAWASSIKPIMLNMINANFQVQINVSAEASSHNLVTVSIGSHKIEREVYSSRTLSIAVDKSYFEVGANLITASMHNYDDPTDKAKDIYFTLIWGVGATEPVVAFANSTQECKQYDLVDIQYFVYDPYEETASYTIQVGSEPPRTLTAKREIKTYQYSPTEFGTVTLTLVCGTASDTMQLTVKKVDYNLNYYKDDSLVYCVDPLGHSNSDPDREEFGKYGEYESFVFSQDFDWENGGFIQDNGIPAFVVKKGNSVVLPRCLLQDNDVTGKTIDISYKVTNSDQYDAVAMQELNDGGTKGIVLKANNGELRLNNSVGQEFRYCEESRIDLSIQVEGNVAQRVVTIWLDGVPSKVNKYSTAGTLVQNENALVIGSENCDVWIYGIRVYTAALDKRQMVQNYVSNGTSTKDKVSRYDTNTILDNSDRITIAALHAAAPNLTIIEIAAPRMTTSKTDKVPADITITDGTVAPIYLLASDGTVFMVQGTSSAAYGRSAYNLDIDFKGSGITFKLSENAIPVNYLNIKVNVASSENANNINAVDWYNTYQPYLTESRNRPGVRDTVEGKPCAVFITNTNTEPVWFSSQLIQPNETVLYAMGDLCNSKKNKAVFGQDGLADEYVTHPTKACIEVSGNDTEPERFRSTAAQFNPEADDGKGRWETIEGGKTIKHFEWRMNPSNADLNDVVTSWDNTVAWVVSTMGDSAKFKEQVGNYFAVDSLLYHFLFIEYFEGYDNVSKNTFYSYDYDETAHDYRWNIKCAYDMDTILAADNDGIPFGDYGIDFDDTIDGQPGSRKYFNAADNTIWVNIKEAFQNELSSMYISLRSKGAWNATSIMNKWDAYQDKRPHVAMMIDAFNKYIEPYKTTATSDYDDSYLPRLNGSKTYWRRQFLTYQTSYMDGKYRYYNTTDTLSFRTNCAAVQKDFTVKAYAKTYITMIKDSTLQESIKIGAGKTATFEDVQLGNNTILYITPDRLVQEIAPLNETDNSTFIATGAPKLTDAILGGENVNTAWGAGTGINIPSAMLKNLSIRNIVNFSQTLDLSSNVELRTLDTRNTLAGFIKLPSFAPLTTVQLNNCTGISAFNLNKVETFTMASADRLVSIWLENCNSVVENAMATYLTAAVDNSISGTKRIRAINVHWSFNNSNVLAKVASTWKGYNSFGDEQNAPVVSGEIHTTVLLEHELEIINSVWGEGSIDDHLDREHKVWSYGGLTITYDSLTPYFKVYFLNVDGNPIKDKTGNDYIQYVDQYGYAYDPIIAGEIDTPTYIDPAGQYYYTYTGWDGLEGQVTRERNVTALYSTEVIKYTVRWYDKVGGMIYDERTNVAYGSEVIYDEDGTIGFPTLSDDEPHLYKVFSGWDKSTGFITGDTDVYATWTTGSIPQEGSTELKDMNIAQIYGIVKNDWAENYFENNDYIDIKVGKDFNFSNVPNSRVLLENRYFNGNEIEKFNDIKLFDEDAETFTLAIDYEFCKNSNYASLANCCSSSDGFKLYYETTGETAKLQWGNEIPTVGHGLNRGIIVLRHIKGQNSLLVASSNDGIYSLHSSENGGDITPDQQPTSYDGYDRYNDTIYCEELVRAQSTLTDAVLSFGAVPVGMSGKDNAAKGWIHWAKIWYADLGEHVIRQIATWPRETWRMRYRGHGIYNIDETGSNPDGASFVADATLSQFHKMYSGSSGYITNVGGWENSLLRSFVNDRCYKALPYEWQAIIGTANVKTRGGYDNPRAMITTKDKLYVPSLDDVSDTAAGESRQIPWYLGNINRVKYMGITIPDNSTLHTNPNDPTLYPGVTVKEGDVWAPNYDSGESPTLTGNKFIYISSTTAAKHDYIGGRYADNQYNNVPAQGAQGGLWVRSITYWLRTPDVRNPSSPSDGYHYYVHPVGNYPSMWMKWDEAYQFKGILLMFSLIGKEGSE